MNVHIVKANHRKLFWHAPAEEMAAGITWSFAPVVAMPQDIRWGRTYGSYCENTDLVWPSVAAYVRGLQNADDKAGLCNPRGRRELAGLSRRNLGIPAGDEG